MTSQIPSYKEEYVWKYTEEFWWKECLNKLHRLKNETSGNHYKVLTNYSEL